MSADKPDIRAVAPVDSLADGLYADAYRGPGTAGQMPSDVHHGKTNPSLPRLAIANEVAFDSQGNPVPYEPSARSSGKAVHGSVDGKEIGSAAGADHSMGDSSGPRLPQPGHLETQAIRKVHNSDGSVLDVTYNPSTNRTDSVYNERTQSITFMDTITGKADMVILPSLPGQPGGAVVELDPRTGKTTSVTLEGPAGTQRSFVPDGRSGRLKAE